MKHYYILGDRGVSKILGKVIGAGVNIKLKETSFLDGPLFRPRAKNGGFQLVFYIYSDQMFFLTFTPLTEVLYEILKI